MCVTLKLLEEEHALSSKVGVCDNKGQWDFPTHSTSVSHTHLYKLVLRMLRGGLSVFIACANKLRLEECVVTRKQVVVVSALIIFILSSADKMAATLPATRNVFRALKHWQHFQCSSISTTLTDFSHMNRDLQRREAKASVLLPSVDAWAPSLPLKPRPPTPSTACTGPPLGRCRRAQFLLLQSSLVLASVQGWPGSAQLCYWVSCNVNTRATNACSA